MRTLRRVTQTPFALCAAACFLLSSLSLLSCGSKKKQNNKKQQKRKKNAFLSLVGFFFGLFVCGFSEVSWKSQMFSSRDLRQTSFQPVPLFAFVEEEPSKAAPEISRWFFVPSKHERK
jgi:hypothetical protein